MFPQAFLTAALQNYARRNRVAVDQLSFSTIVNPAHFGQTEGGYRVTGLFLDGASWDGCERMFHLLAVTEWTPEETVCFAMTAARSMC